MGEIAADVLESGDHLLGDRGELRLVLGELVTDSHFESVVALAAHARRPGQVVDLSEIDAMLANSLRKTGGVYFTPSALADFMAAKLPAGVAVVDPSCGAGALLIAAVEAGRGPVTGIEPNPVLALAAAIRVRAKSDDIRHRIVNDDSLESMDWGQACVLSNPPYLGEKGNKAVFDALRAKHPSLAPYFGARIDLHYVFIRRALDLMAPGATAVFLTSEYWLSASGAGSLRQDLCNRAGFEALWQLGAGRFVGAPGHHSLVFKFTKTSKQTEAATFDAHAKERHWTPSDLGIWSPFTDETAVQGRVRLGEVLRDYQGFVTGADKAFMGQHPEHPLWRPVLRARDCVANRIFIQPPKGHDSVLWLDQEVRDPALLAYVDGILGGVRERLERRREVKSGTMPWYRIHWPRRASDQVGPKLVVPRRATSPRFCLDLSGCAISSDCTYLTGGVSLDELIALMLILNHSNTTAYLAHAGKQKGAITEYYSEPLRQIPVGEWGEASLEVELGEQLARALRRFREEKGQAWVDVLAPG